MGVGLRAFQEIGSPGEEIMRVKTNMGLMSDTIIESTKSDGSN